MITKWSPEKLGNLPKIPTGTNVTMLYCFFVIIPEADSKVINMFLKINK